MEKNYNKLRENKKRDDLKQYKKNCNNYNKWKKSTKKDDLKQLYNENKRNSFKLMDIHNIMFRLYILGGISNNDYDWDIVDTYNEIYRNLFRAAVDIIKNNSKENLISTVEGFGTFDCSNVNCKNHEDGCKLQSIHPDCKIINKK